MTRPSTATSVHPFEEAGLGLAPFRFVGMREVRGPLLVMVDGVEFQVGAPGQPMGTCAYCGQGIAVCCDISSADGKRFTVGSDCVAKVEREDNRVSPILTEVEKWKKARAADKREEKRVAAWHRARERRAATVELLDGHPSLGADKPHPYTHRAERGDTLRDYWRYCLKNGGATAWRAVAVEIAAAITASEAAHV